MSIYKITNTVTDHYYYGSTTMSLEDRLQGHKSDAIERKSTKAYGKFLEVGLKNLRIELVQKCPDIEDLKMIENTYIKPVYKTDPLCLNSNLAIREEETKEKYKHNWLIKDKESNPQKYELKNETQRNRYWRNHEAELQRGAIKREKNREDLRIKSKAYYQTVKDRRARLILCEICNKQVTSANMNRHCMSESHLRNKSP